jgi:pimeloyl-ACP methyl ester carboxylesterase
MRTDFLEHGRWWATLLIVGQLRYDVNPRLPEITTPTLLIFGSAAPPFLRMHQDQAAAAIPNARLERVPGASAHSPFDAPETWVPLVVDFLDGDEG